MSGNNGWIKCSERLPKPNTRVLICSREKEVGVALYQELIGFGYIPLYGEVTHWKPLPQPPEEQIMAKYLYRYALESNNPTNNDDGNTWEDESRCFDNVALHIAKENAYAWDMFEEPEREVMYVWRDGDFENRLRFLAKFEVIQRLDVIELEEDDDPDDF